MLPDVVTQQFDLYNTRILYGDHRIGLLTEHPDHHRKRVLFSTPTGQIFRLPDCDTVAAGTAALVVVALSYHYLPHQITLRKADKGVVLWCPTCEGVGVRRTPTYPTLQFALEHAAVDHAELCGHPAVLVDRPHTLAPNVAPANAVATDESGLS